MKIMFKFIVSFILTFLVIFFYLRYKNNKINFNHTFKDNIPFYLGCQNPQEGELEINSSVVVHDDFVKKYNLIKNPKNAISKQLLFLQGYFYFSNNNPIMITENIVDIEVLETKATKYNRDLEIIYDERYFHYLYPKSYTGNINLNKSDSAIEIKYKAKIKAISCMSGLTENIYAKLPIDPYLAYWSLPQKEFKTFRGFGKTVVINPCVSLRYIQVNYSPDYWYFWKPDASGRDFLNAKFSCTDSLKVGRDIIIPKMKFFPRYVK